MTSVVIGDSVVSIGDHTFEYCDALTEVAIIGNGAASIGDYAFSYCFSLASVTIGNGVTYIGEKAFQKCELKSIKIGENVKKIGKYAFWDSAGNCSVFISNLSSWCNINFENEYSNPIFWFGYKLYLNEKEVTEVVIPKEQTKIKKFTFINCESLKKVVIHKDVVEIDEGAFNGCDALVECYCYAKTPPRLSNFYGSGSIIFYNRYPFTGINKESILYVPSRCGAEYKSSNWGEDFKNIKEMD